MNIKRPLCAVIGLAVLVVLVPAGITSAETRDDAQIPADVLAWFEEHARAVIDATEPVTVDGRHDSGTIDQDLSKGYEIGHPVPAFTWTEEFIEDSNAAQISEQINLWIAPLVRGDVSIGTIAAWRSPTNSKVELAYYDNDAAVGDILPDVTDDDRLIIDTASESYIVAGNDTDEVVVVTPNSKLSAESQEITSLDAVHDAIEERTEEIATLNLGPDAGGGGQLNISTGPSGAVIAITIGAGLVLICLVTLAVMSRKQRKATVGSSVKTRVG